MVTESDRKLLTSGLKLTCWKCGRYATDVAVEGRAVVKTNCKSANCNHVVCYEVTGNNQESLDLVTRALAFVAEHYNVKFDRELSGVAREICAAAEIFVRPGEICEVKRQWLEPKPVLF